jgi:hypothetical protein
LKALHRPDGFHPLQTFFEAGDPLPEHSEFRAAVHRYRAGAKQDTDT